MKLSLFVILMFLNNNNYVETNLCEFFSYDDYPDMSFEKRKRE